MKRATVRLVFPRMGVLSKKGSERWVVLARLFLHERDRIPLSHC